MDCSPKMVKAAALQYDVIEVATLLHARLGGRTFFSLEDVLEVCPELRGKDTVGFDGRGRMAFKCLARDQRQVKHERRTDRKLVLAAMYDCAAPPHFHKGGEVIFSLRGELQEHQWSGDLYRQFPTHQGPVVAKWDCESLHQPFTAPGSCWIGVYDQPMGLHLFTMMNKREMLHALMKSIEVEPDMLAGAESWSEKETRERVSNVLGLKMPKS